MSHTRQQAYIDAPVQVVWDLISDVDRHPEWWPRVLEVECDGLEPSCTYREVVKTPFGEDEMILRVDELRDCEQFTIRCVNTGTFVKMALTPAQEGTFLDARMGMEPGKLGDRVWDAVAGKRYFRNWLQISLAAMREVAEQRAAGRPSA